MGVQGSNGRSGGFRLGTRGSPLALAQAHMVRNLIAASGRASLEQVEIRIFKTSGDRIQDRPLSEVGGKGLFTKELEDALLADEIDFAVHSMKDVATRLPDGLTISTMLPREDVRDAWLSPTAQTLADLPTGALVGTSSLRRQAQVLRLRPDLKVVQFRGNVETRLTKLDQGVAHATMLAVAGLNRLGLAHKITSITSTDMMLPAVAQGAVGIELRVGDEAVAQLLSPLDHQPTSLCVTAERAFLAVLDGSCRTPIGGLAQLDDSGRLTFRGEILTPDGREVHATSRTGTPQSAIQMGEDAARELLARAGPNFFAAPDNAPGPG
jgi:hydroxymethylbilane synthase